MCPYMEKVTFEGAPKNIEEYPLDGYYINYDHKENVIFRHFSLPFKFIIHFESRINAHFIVSDTAAEQPHQQTEQSCH